MRFFHRFGPDGTIIIEEMVLEVRGNTMKTAICYYSKHHGNTLKVISAMAEGNDIRLIDVTAKSTVRLDEYDCIGFASGIYGFEMSSAVVSFARQYLPENRKVFFVYTYGGIRGRGAANLRRIAAEKHCQVLGEFSCRGYVTFGPFRLVGGVGRKHPTMKEYADAREFFADIERK